MEKIRIGILGTGTIANKMAQAINITSNATLYAVASRDINKARLFAQKHSAKVFYGSYEEAINDENIDLIYIALPHPFHYTVSKMCLLNGKNVLCEKPLTVNSKQAKELFEIAEENNLFFSEAMWTRFLPSVKIVTDTIKKGKIGTVKKIKGVIAHNSTRVNRMSDPSLAGGMLLDCGIYLITSVFLVLGNNYTGFKTKAKLSKKGVDLHSKTTLLYPDDTIAKFYMAMDFRLGNKIKIIGTKGSITMNTVYNWQNIRLKTKDGTAKISVPVQKAGGFEYMIEKVCSAILQGKGFCKDVTPHDTLAVMHLMDAMRERWGLKYPFE